MTLTTNNEIGKLNGKNREEERGKEREIKREKEREIERNRSEYSKQLLHSFREVGSGGEGGGTMYED